MTPVEATTHANRLRRLVAVLPGVLVALLPRIGCPACWPALAGVLSAVGLGFLVDNRGYLLPLTALLLGVALLALAHGGLRGRTGGYWPLAIGTLSAGAVLVGKFVLDSAPLTYAGAGALLLGSLWASGVKQRLPTGKAQAACPCAATANNKQQQE